MKNTKLLLAIAIITFFCSFAAAEWINFESREGRFALKFPKQPATEAQDADKDGVHIKMHLFVYDATKYKDDNQVYLAMYCDYPDTLVNSDFKDEIVDTIMKGSLQGMAENMNGKMVSYASSNYKGFPVRSAKINIKDSDGGMGFAYVNMYLVHNRMYMLEVLCEPKNDRNASISKFFDSFTLLVKAPAAKKPAVKH